MRHNRLAVFVHLVWGTWDRHPLLVGAIERHVYRAIGAKCEELGADLVALGGVEDHVHLLVCLPATVSIADLLRVTEYIAHQREHHTNLSLIPEWEDMPDVESQI